MFVAPCLTGPLPFETLPENLQEWEASKKNQEDARMKLGNYKTTLMRKNIEALAVHETMDKWYHIYTSDDDEDSLAKPDREKKLPFLKRVFHRTTSVTQQ